MPAPVVRAMQRADEAEWRRMRWALWPDQSAGDAEEWLNLPDTVTLVASYGAAVDALGGGGLCGFAEARVRPMAEGCETQPVAYLEGWWVDPAMRRRGVGGALARAVEAWARGRGLRELASDAEWENELSQVAHRALGFEEVERVVLFRRVL